MIQLKESNSEYDYDYLLDKYHGESITISDITRWAKVYIESYDGDNPHMLNAQYAYNNGGSGTRKEFDDFINDSLDELYYKLREYEKMTDVDIDESHNEIEDLIDYTKWDWSEFDYYEDERIAQSEADFESDFPGYGSIYHD